MLSFFTENRMSEAPFNKIASAMYASIALKAAGGQKEPPNQGTFTDVGLISTLLPYCDAMFMDNKCRAILEDIPRHHRVNGTRKVYSLNRRRLSDLSSLMKAAATPEHLSLLGQVYGDRGTV
jgi:hypothetical protein